MVRQNHLPITSFCAKSLSAIEPNSQKIAFAAEVIEALIAVGENLELEILWLLEILRSASLLLLAAE